MVIPSSPPSLAIAPGQEVTSWHSPLMRFAQPISHPTNGGCMLNCIWVHRHAGCLLVGQMAETCGRRGINGLQLVSIAKLSCHMNLQRNFLGLYKVGFLLFDCLSFGEPRYEHQEGGPMFQSSQSRLIQIAESPNHTRYVDEVEFGIAARAWAVPCLHSASPYKVLLEGTVRSQSIIGI
jgi:hypothetical protein